MHCNCALTLLTGITVVDVEKVSEANNINYICCLFIRIITEFTSNQPCSQMALRFFWLMQAFLLANSSTPTTNPAAPARTSPIALEVVPETVTAQSLCADVAKFVNTNHSGRPRADTPTAAKKSAKRTIIPHVARLFVKYANQTLLQGQLKSRWRMCWVTKARRSPLNSWYKGKETQGLSAGLPTRLSTSSLTLAPAITATRICMA